jgi:hypothetical protein
MLIAQDPRPIVGLDMSIEQMHAAALRLCHFAPTGSGTFARDLLDFLVESALAANDGPHEIAAISMLVQQVVPLHFEYEEVLESLKRLLEGKTIYCTHPSLSDPGARAGLQLTRRAEMDNSVRHAEAMRRDAVDAWISDLAQKHAALTQSDLRDLELDLTTYVVGLICVHGAECVALLYQDGKQVAEWLERVRSQIPDGLPARANYVEAIRAVELPAFLQSSDAKRKAYIGGLLNSAFLIHMLHLDPQCSAIVRAQLGGGVLYLDTNVIYRLLGLKGPEKFLAAKRLIEISRELNYEPVVSPRTVTEFKQSLRHNARILFDMPILPDELLDVAIQATSDDDFVHTYYQHRKQRSSWVTPELFIDYYDQLEDLLSSCFQISVTKEPETVQIEDRELSAQVSKLTTSLEHSRRDKFGDDDPPLPHDEVLRHDAYHRLLVLKLRGAEQSKFSDTRYWFLTCDSKLPRYDRFVRGGDAGVPFCALTGQWLQVLRPFLPRHEDFDQVLAASVTSRVLGAFKQVPGDIIHEIMGRLSLVRPMSPGVAARIVANKQFVEQFAATDTEPARHELLESEFAKIADEFERERSAMSGQLEQMQQTQVSLTETAAAWRDKVGGLERELEGLRARGHEQEADHRREIAEANTALSQLRTEMSSERADRREEQAQLASALDQLRHQLEHLASANRELSRAKHQRDQLVTALKWSVPGVATALACACVVWGKPWISFQPPWNVVVTAVIGVLWLVSWAVPLRSSRVLSLVGFVAAVAETIAVLVALLAPGGGPPK